MSTGLMTAASGRLSRRRTLLGRLFGLALPALATLISVSDRRLLSEGRRVFGGSSVALVARQRRGWQRVAIAGSDAGSAPDAADADVAIDDDGHLSLRGRTLTPRDRRVLQAVAGQALFALRG